MMQWQCVPDRNVPERKFLDDPCLEQLVPGLANVSRSWAAYRRWKPPGTYRSRDPSSKNFSLGTHRLGDELTLHQTDDRKELYLHISTFHWFPLFSAYSNYFRIFEKVREASSIPGCKRACGLVFLTCCIHMYSFSQEWCPVSQGRCTVSQ